jgi:hypothetical protein
VQWPLIGGGISFGRDPDYEPENPISIALGEVGMFVAIFGNYIWSTCCSQIFRVAVK